MVTTKRGRVGRTTVTYNGNFSIDQVAKKYKMLNAEQYKQVAQQVGTTIDDGGANTDWFKEITRTPKSQSHNLSLSGGSERTTYYAALNYRNLQSLDRGGQREFVNGTLRLNTKALNDKMDFSILLTNAYDKRSFANYGAIAQSLNMDPTYPVKNPDGSFFENPDIPYFLQWNPVANMANNVNSNKEKRLLGNVNLGYLILPGLRATASYSMTRNDFLHGSYSSNEDFFQVQGGTGGQASRAEDNTRTSIIESTINYNKQAGNHNFDVTAGYSYQNIFSEGFSAGNNSFNTNAFLYNNLEAGSALNNLTQNFNRGGVSINSYANERALLAYFGRLIYNYNERYLLNLTVRREGASVLGKDNKWGTFPGVSVGWVLSKEDFMQNAAFIKYLKLRAGYGVTGNQESLQPYQSLATLGPFSQNAYLGIPGSGQWIIPYGPTINANPDLRWETKKEVNIGVDFALLKNGWLTGSLEYYSRRINNLVGYYNAQLPSQVFPNIFANAGLMKNEGYEVTLNAKFANSKNFNWNTTFTGAYNKNLIVSVTSDQFQGTAHNITDFGLGQVQRLAPGQPVGVFYGRVFAGFTPEGKWLFNNKEGKPVTAEEIGDNDFAYLGNSIPKYNLGLTNNFKFRNLDATILLRSAFGFKALNAKRLYHENAVNIYTMNLFTSAIDKPVNAEQYFSTYYLEKGDYLKIDNLTIGYSIPVKNNLYLQNLRFYVTGTNLATFTGFSGMDPELPLNLIFPSAREEFTAGPGVEPNYGYYPTTRTFTMGISATF
ncbi:MAG: SusC/RagA family TonB-linked outer membrane protein [Segetibacter sp.]